MAETSPIIVAGESVDELYGRLLVLRRRHEINLQKGSALCLTCGRKKSEHLRDQLCDVSALSKTFTYKHAKFMEKVNRGLQLIEELKEL